MKFWELREPAGSDYRHVQVSGKLDHLYRLPEAVCEDCDNTVSESDIVLPYECPDWMRKHRLLTDLDAEVPTKDFKRLERQIVAELRRNGIKQPQLIPGAFLQPCFLDVPSVPTVDFLWSDLSSGLSTIVVSGRVYDLLREHTKTAEIALCPVTPRKIGGRSAKSTPKLPKRGEPEDMMKAYKVAKANGVGPYYELIVLARSGYPPGAEPGPVCGVCGEALQRGPERFRSQRRAWESLTADGLESIWGGSSVFRLAGQGTVLVTDELKNRLEEMQSSNIAFREFPMAQPSAAPKHRPARLSATQKPQKGDVR